jgi:hypothetical protein
MTKKWNMVIDVALCHDCNNCFMACKDEYVGNDFKGYSAAQPWFGQRWMNIERKERGQFPMVQVAFLPTPCQHCDDAPCVTRDGAVEKHKNVWSSTQESQGSQGDRGQLPLRRHLLERGGAATPEMYRVRPPDRRWLDRDPLHPGVPHRRSQAGLG